MAEIEITFQVEATGNGDGLLVDVVSRAAEQERHTRRPPVALSDVAACWTAIFEALVDYKHRLTVERLTCRVIEGTGSDAGQQALRTLVQVAAHETGVAVVWGDSPLESLGPVRP
ncbi:MAG: hypothetical protein M0R06_03600 [Sphaerochaeta sp.]|jgi:hypothetical protein|nr:hypothetical protein [Sphaerochaeta sp.]